MKTAHMRPNDAEAGRRGGGFQRLELSGVNSSSFAARGGIINFYLRGAHDAFEINLEAARAKGLKFSAQMLSLARNVSTKPENKP